MINFRVRSLDAIVAQLRAAGIPVEIDQQRYPNGRFARLNDPEGILLNCGILRGETRPGKPEDYLILRRGYSNSLRVLAISRRRSSINAKTVPASNFPSPFFCPAVLPVSISMPCSTLATGQM